MLQLKKDQLALQVNLEFFHKNYCHIQLWHRLYTITAVPRLTQSATLCRMTTLVSARVSIQMATGEYLAYGSLLQTQRSSLQLEL